MPLSLASGFDPGLDEFLDRRVASDIRGEEQQPPGPGEDDAASQSAARAADDPLSASGAASDAPLIRIMHEADGQWSVSTPAGSRSRFADIAGALAFARQSYATAPATLWLDVDGFVVVVPQEAAWPRPANCEPK